MFSGSSMERQASKKIEDAAGVKRTPHPLGLPPVTLTAAFQRCWDEARNYEGYNEREWVEKYQTLKSAFPMLGQCYEPRPYR